jgi:catechol 2,3-dioxygenase-like lactoylglutathione lyase family enzyme
MIKTYGLTHIALAVKNAKRSFEFYRKVFGMIEVYNDNGFLQAQTPGSRDVIVFDESAPRIGKRGGIAGSGESRAATSPQKKAARSKKEREGAGRSSRLNQSAALWVPEQIAHFGFRLIKPEDIEAAAKAVKKAGGKILDKGEFVPGEPYLFFKDPDGYVVEIWYELPTRVDPK